MHIADGFLPWRWLTQSKTFFFPFLTFFSLVNSVFKRCNVSVIKRLSLPTSVHAESRLSYDRKRWRTVNQNNGEEMHSSKIFFKRTRQQVPPSPVLIILVSDLGLSPAPLYATTPTVYWVNFSKPLKVPLWIIRLPSWSATRWTILLGVFPFHACSCVEQTNNKSKVCVLLNFSQTQNQK